MKKLMFAALAAMGTAIAANAAKTATDLPVSSIGNTACMSSMSERPWWNKAWTRRAPILISSAANVEDRNVMVDAIVDFGEEINPDEVRLITPWEEEVPCVVEKVERGKIRLLFKTTLRVRENKPFLVYWGNPKAKKIIPVSSLQMYREDGDMRVMNGKLDVTFDLRKRTPGLLRRLRILGSQAPSEILMRASGYAWDGFVVNLGQGGWTNATIVADNAFKKAVAFDFPNGIVTMTVYDEQPRVDWSYEMTHPWSTEMSIIVSWACGGDCGFDRLVYPGLAGKDLSVMAELDSATDCIPHPKYDFTPYVRDGWYALYDRRVNDVVGMVFDRKALGHMSCYPSGQAYGVPVWLKFGHKFAKKGEPSAAGSGALVATMGRWQDVRAEYERLNAKPLVYSGKPESVHDIPVTRPRLDHDWVYSIDANGWHTTEPLDGTEWATNSACHLRALGANVSRSGPNWAGVPVPHDLYVSVTNKVLALHPDRAKNIAKWGEKDNFTGRKFTERCDAAHAKGMSVSIWGSFCPATHDLDRADPELVKYDIEIQNLYPKCGMDCVYNAAAQGEGPQHTLPSALKVANGNEDFRRWKNIDDFFKAQDENTARVKAFYQEAKKRNPDVPVVMWNSENSEVGREMFMGDQAGYFDTCMVEILSLYDIVHVKNVVKRMRALFDNDAGRTVHQHFYFYGTDRQDFSERINQVELPFVCGCNGFSQENLTYEHNDRDATQIPADFARFAEYTRLGEKAAKMEPVKNLAVFRDGAMYRYDVKNRLEGGRYNWRTRTDDRINSLGRLRNYSFDIVVNRYFTKEALAKYHVVYVPEDPVFTEDLAKELLAYVKQGGGAILEGDSLGAKTLNALALKDGEIKAVGMGKIVWFEKPPAFDAKFQRTVAELGGKNPYDIESKTLDSVLQVSTEGLFLGVFNTGNVEDRGRVKISEKVKSDSERVYVLDVKRGKRFAWTNGFEIAVAPRQCGYYLIGDDAFTALPEAKPGVWDGATLEATIPNAEIPVAHVPTNFKQAVAVEFTRGTVAKPQTTRRSFENAIIVRPMTKDVYSIRKMNEVLEDATYLHFVATDTAAADKVFEDCPDALKALLKRGGGIIFDRMTTGLKARAFLKGIGVYDPNETAVSKNDDAVLCSNLSTNSFLYPNKAGWFNQGLHFDRGFPKWDKENQIVTHVGKHHPELAMAVAQDKVLGAGKVIFAQNERAFNDWYENMRYGDSIQSWMIGRQVSEHAKLVKDMNGGEGRVEE